MFFDQIKEIDGNLKDLRDHLKDIGGAVDVHFDQLDDIAAHIIALEAVMVQVLRKSRSTSTPPRNGCGSKPRKTLARKAAAKRRRRLSTISSNS